MPLKPFADIKIGKPLLISFMEIKFFWETWNDCKTKIVFMWKWDFFGQLIPRVEEKFNRNNLIEWRKINF